MTRSGQRLLPLACVDGARSGGGEVAELLVTLTDHVLPGDPDATRRFCFGRGHVVAVMPDGHTWGGRERPPRFAVIRLPGVPPQALADLLEHDPDPIAPAETYRIRRRALDLDRLPAAVRSSLAAAGRITLPEAALRAAVRDLRAGWRST